MLQSWKTIFQAIVSFYKSRNVPNDILSKKNGHFQALLEVENIALVSV